MGIDLIFYMEFRFYKSFVEVFYLYFFFRNLFLEIWRISMLGDDSFEDKKYLVKFYGFYFLIVGGFIIFG